MSWKKWELVEPDIPEYYRSALREVADNWAFHPGYASAAMASLGLLSRFRPREYFERIYGAGSKPESASFMVDGFTTLAADDPVDPGSDAPAVDFVFFSRFFPHRDECRKLLMVPFAVHQDEVYVAMANPAQETDAWGLLGKAGISQRQRKLRRYLCPVNRIIDFLLSVEYVLSVNGRFKLQRSASLDEYERMFEGWVTLARAEGDQDLIKELAGPDALNQTGAEKALDQLFSEFCSSIHRNVLKGGSRFCIGILNLLKIMLKSATSESAPPHFAEFVSNLLFFIRQTIHQTPMYVPYLSAIAVYHALAMPPKPPSESLPRSAANTQQRLLRIYERLNKTDAILHKDYQALDDKILPALLHNQKNNVIVVVFGLPTSILRRIGNYLHLAPDRFVFINRFLRNDETQPPPEETPYVWRSKLFVDILSSAWARRTANSGSRNPAKQFFSDIDTAVEHVVEMAARTGAEVRVVSGAICVLRQAWYSSRNGSAPTVLNEDEYCCEFGLKQFVDALREKGATVTLCEPYIGESKQICDHDQEVKKAFIPYFQICGSIGKKTITAHFREFIPTSEFMPLQHIQMTSSA